jgi:hypothetical protein
MSELFASAILIHEFRINKLKIKEEIIELRTVQLDTN